MKQVSVRLGWFGRLLFAQFLLFGGLSHEAGAAPLGVGYRETLDVSVPVATTSNLTDRISISEGTLNKSGAGTLALAASNLTVQSGGALIVRSGTLLISGDTNTVKAAAPCPLDVMAQAAFWLDATTNVVAVSSNGNTYADTWLDVRETNTVAPYTYTRAIANFALTNNAPQVLANAGVSGLMPSVWFGRYNSLQTMTWTTPANAVADITKIYHVFVLHGVFQSYGYVLGTMGGDPDFHIQEYNGGSVNAPLWHQTEWSTTAVRQGRTYLDGERVDGTMVPPKAGWQLLEVALGAKLAHAANFFNDRNITAYGKRVGGDNVCEAVIFTNRLSETDRLRVQQYLTQKWLGRNSVGALTASASASGTVAADVAMNSSQTFRLTGDGTVQKTGDGTAVLDDTPAIKSVFRAASVEGGVLDARVPVPLSLTAGNRVTASNTALTVTLDAGVGQIVKEGIGTVTLTSLPQDLARLTVNSGVLVLTPPVASNTVAVQISGTISNATFEAEQLTSYRRSIVNGETYYGWTAYVPAATGSADNAVFIFNRSADATKWPCDYEAPEGKQVLALKQDASASTPLSLPVAGIYDLSFYTSARSFLSGKHEFDLCIVDGAVTNIAATVQAVNQPYIRQTFRLPWLEAGNHTLLFRRNVMGLDTLGTIDDMKVTLVSETKPNSLKIFNGDFELTTYPRDYTAFSTSNLAPGWTFTCATNGITTSGITMANSAAPYNFYTPSSPYGAVELGIYSNGSASTALTLPAGTYKLQGDVCNWPCQLNGRTVAGTQSIKATVTRGSGTTDILGTVATNASMLSAAVWPTAFTVTNNEAVTLALTGQSLQSGGLVDNLFLIPQTTPIIQNGSFEAGSNWTFESNTNGNPKASASYNNLSQSNDYGNAVYDGPRRLLLVQTGAAVQDIQIPAAGLYRLVLHAVQRTPLTYANTYGHNPVRAWLAQAGVTNVLGWTRVDDSVFVRREFLFPVAAAGTYRLGLQGMTDNSPQFPGTDQNALIDGVSIERVTNLGDTGFALPKELAVTVANGARLQLSYIGTQTVDSVSYAGHFISGVISQQTCPAFVSGPGVLYASPKGTLILLR